MVKILSHTDNEAITVAIEKAEKKTCAEIAIAITPASDAYFDVVLLCGLLLSALVTLSLYEGGITTDYVELLAVQIAILSALYFVRPLHRLCIRLVPRAIKEHRCARRAMEEYHAIHRQLPVAAPFVLLFVSSAERYAHVLPSRVVHEKISGEHWDAVIKDFVTAAPSGLAKACIVSIEHISVITAEHFPENGRHHNFSNQPIENE